jgi:hypothetical protein
LAVTTTDKDFDIPFFWFVLQGKVEPRKGLLLGSSDSHFLVVFCEDQVGSVTHLVKAITGCHRSKEEAKDSIIRRDFP